MSQGLLFGADVASPRSVSIVVEDDALIETGARMLGFSLKQHQLDIGSDLDRREETNAICIGRRAGKTTAVWAWMLGRCEREPNTSIVTTAQKGIKARDRFMSVARIVERTFPEAAGGPKIYRGAGHEALAFRNGSRLRVCAPDAESVRGDGDDVVYVDEPQELEPEKSLDLEQGVMPMFDTLDGMVILSGTPGLTRAGWFWNALEAGRAGEPGHVLVECAADEADDLDDEAVWWRVHPGLASGMTTIEKLRQRRSKLGRARFAREYLGVWPRDAEQRAIPSDVWERTALDDMAAPARLALAFDVAPDSSEASIVAAWRDDDGRAVVKLVAAGPGAAWVAQDVLKQARRRRGVHVGWDAIGANLEVAEILTRRGSGLGDNRRHALAMRDMVTAARGFYSGLKDETILHVVNPELDAAASAAAWRDTGDSGSLFGRRASAGPVSGVVAASVAVLTYDRMPVPAPTKIRVYAGAS